MNTENINHAESNVKTLECGEYSVLQRDEVSSSAIRQIKTYIGDNTEDETDPNRLFKIGQAVDSVGIDWITNRGTWPKRLARALKKTASTNGTKMIVQDSIDWSRGTYGDDGSCYWGDRSGAKDMILENDGFALLFHGPNNEPLARCWCLPWESSYILFNAYARHGEAIELTTFARVVQDITGLPYYRKINLTNQGTASGTLWINSNMGFVVGPAEVAETESVDLDIEKQEPRCCCCGDDCGDDSYQHDGESYCSDCFYERFTTCHHCEETISNDYSYRIGEDGEYDYCEDCYQELARTCQHCDTEGFKDDMYDFDGDWYCEDCYNDNVTSCHECGDDIWIEDASEHDGEYYCDHCFSVRTAVCYNCEERILRDDSTTLGHRVYCEDCAEDLFECAFCGEVLERTGGELESEDGRLICDHCECGEVAA
jgi:hypothetical protein